MEITTQTGPRAVKALLANQGVGWISQQSLPRQMGRQRRVTAGFSPFFCVSQCALPRKVHPRAGLPGHKSSTTAVVPSALLHLAWSDRKPVLGKHHTRAAELILTSRRKINHWSKTGGTVTSVYTVFRKHIKNLFKYIIKGSPFNFKNTRHSINDSQFMKATTLKCYKSFTTPRY